MIEKNKNYVTVCLAIYLGSFFIMGEVFAITCTRGMFRSETRNAYFNGIREGREKVSYLWHRQYGSSCSRVGLVEQSLIQEVRASLAYDGISQCRSKGL